MWLEASSEPWSKLPLAIVLLATSLFAQQTTTITVSTDPSSAHTSGPHNPAVLHARGLVIVDARAVQETSPLFINQKVETRGSTATLDIPGGSIELANGSWLIYRDTNAVELGCGKADVISESAVPVTARLEHIVIVTGPTPSKTWVSDVLGRFRVEAVRGSAQILDGNHEQHLKQGEVYERASRKECAIYAPPEAAHAPGSAGPGHLLRDVGIVGGVAGAPVAICLALHCLDNAASDPAP